MDFASLLLGLIVLLVAWGLERYRRSRHWQTAQPTQLDQDYAAARQRGRGWTNGLVALIGGLIVLAGLAGRGPIWYVLWVAVPLVLVPMVGLACIDMLRTERYLQAKIPELERQSLRGIDSSWPASAKQGDITENEENRY
ncbi:hypothetical protein SH139x_004848 [Planctomycetaceae bacterium SH139]